MKLAGGWQCLRMFSQAMGIVQKSLEGKENKAPHKKSRGIEFRRAPYYWKTLRAWMLELGVKN